MYAYLVEPLTTLHTYYNTDFHTMCPKKGTLIDKHKNFFSQAGIIGINKLFTICSHFCNKIVTQM